MSQSSVIAGSLLLAYVIFVITKGELPCYLQLLGIATQASCPKGQAVAAVGTTGATGATGATGVSIGLGLLPSRGGGSSGIGIGSIGIGGINIGIGGIGGGIGGF